MEPDEDFSGPTAADWIAGLCASTLAQAVLWRQVPWLALQTLDPDEETISLTATGAWVGSDGNGPGYSQDSLLLAVTEGYWPIGLIGDTMMYTAYIDCATGQIVDAAEPSQPVPDTVVAALLDNPIEVDAVTIVARLQRAVAARVTPDPHAAWRRALATEYGLSPRAYQRLHRGDLGLG